MVKPASPKIDTEGGNGETGKCAGNGEIGKMVKSVNGNADMVGNGKTLKQAGPKIGTGGKIVKVTGSLKW